MVSPRRVLKGEEVRRQRIALDAIHQSRIEALARSKGLACDACGSGHLYSAEEAHRTPDRGARVEMRCGNGAAHPWSAGSSQELALSPEEARRTGLG
jgi:hypothetical protein